MWLRKTCAAWTRRKLVTNHKYSPVPPAGDADSLDDEDHHLAKKHKEEEEEADGAVGPKRKKEAKLFLGGTSTLNVSLLTIWTSNDQHHHHHHHHSMPTVCSQQWSILTWRPYRWVGTSRGRNRAWRGWTRGWRDQSQYLHWSPEWRRRGRQERWGTESHSSLKNTVTVGNNVKRRGSNCLSPPPPAFNSCWDKQVNKLWTAAVLLRLSPPVGRLVRPEVLTHPQVVHHLTDPLVLRGDLLWEVLVETWFDGEILGQRRPVVHFTCQEKNRTSFFKRTCWWITTAAV